MTVVALCRKKKVWTHLVCDVDACSRIANGGTGSFVNRNRSKPQERWGDSRNQFLASFGDCFLSLSGMCKYFGG
jgi:hypothetical protein